MDASEIRPGQLVVFKHSRHADPMDGAMATVTEYCDATLSMWMIEFGDGEKGFAFPDELTLVVPAKKPALRDLGALYREMHKDIEQLHYNHGGDLERIAAELAKKYKRIEGSDVEI